MKAVVVEIRDKYVAAMSEDGRIIRCKNQNYEIGQVIIMEATKNKLSKKLFARLACGVACIALVSVSAWAYFSPYTYVSLDVNPSIEYKVNRFDIVIEYSAVNDDGEKILNTLEIKNKNIKQAIKETVQKIADEGYFKDTQDAGVEIAISCPDDQKQNQLVKATAEEVDKAVAEKGVDAEVEAEGVGLERVRQAKELGVTPGKLNLVEKLQASNSDEEIDVEKWLTQPVKNIMSKIKENKKHQKENRKSDLETNQEGTQTQDQNQTQTQDQNQIQTQQQVHTQSNTTTQKGNNSNNNSQKPNSNGNSSKAKNN